MSKLIVIAPVRKESERVKRKLLRPFAGSDLFTICAEKLARLNVQTYIATCEEEFRAIAKHYDLLILERTRESIESEKADIIHNYLRDVDADIIFMVNPCCPLLRIETIESAIEATRVVADGVLSVVECRRLIFDTNGNVVNRDPWVVNSKTMLPNYISANAFLSFRRGFFLKNRQYWSFTRGNPERFSISDVEATDIDTLHDFKKAEDLWWKTKCAAGRE